MEKRRLGPGGSDVGDEGGEFGRALRKGLDAEGGAEAEAQAWQDKLEALYDDAALAALVAGFGYAKEPQT